MAASQLSLIEQKNSLSAKKKKKKKVKNILGLPSSIKVESVTINDDEFQKLSSILERLLALARIPFQESNKKLVGEKSNNEIDQDKLEAVKQAKAKRKQLALGVNDLNRSIKRNQIAGALLADDIHPKFLTHHLNLLCKHNKVPLLHVPGLREITNKNLGFPCIALGFKKGFEEFNDAISLIQTMADVKDENFRESSEDESVNIEESQEEKQEFDTENSSGIESAKTLEKSFTYLYRSDATKRVFIPENYLREDGVADKADNEFIQLEDNETETVDCSVVQSSFSKPCQIFGRKAANRKKSNETKLSEIWEEEDYDVPKKKRKSGWTVDKIGSRKNFVYSPAKIIKFQGNEMRKSRGKK